MLTHEVDIAFSPQSRVGSLAVSDDGKIIAWSESDQSVNILVEMGKAQKISIESDAKGIFFQDNNLIYADDDFGVKCVDTSGETIWQCEIPGGVSLLKKCQDFIAVVDNLGRLSTLSHQGNSLKSFHQFTSIIMISPYSNGVIVVLESGSVHFFDGQHSVWNRPARGEVGESITNVGLTAENKLIIGREGYALVPGEEEALEPEVWDVTQDSMLFRCELKNRLLLTCDDNKVTYLGFDDGSVHQLTYQSDNTYLLSEELSRQNTQ